MTISPGVQAGEPDPEFTVPADLSLQDMIDRLASEDLEWGDLTPEQQARYLAFTDTLG